jgi:hypothetical protein
MLIDEMHYEFDLRLDRVASQDRPDFYDNEKDAYLNRAIDAWVGDRYNFNQQTKKGFETDQMRISNLMTLHIEYPLQQPLVPLYHGNGRYELQLRDLSFPYWFLTSARVLIEKDDCSKSIDHKNWQIDDRKNTFNEPNFDWGRVHANFGKSTLNSDVNADLYSLYFDTTDYKDDPQFTIKNVRLSYIKQPNRVCLGTYIHIDDKTTVPPNNSSVVHCDIHESFHDEIVDEAVKFAFKDIQDQFGYQSSQQITNDNK